MTMNKEEIFSVWAPEGSPWSNWAKPVLFAHMDAALAVVTQAESAVDVSSFPPADGKTVMVLDLPGAEGVQVGMALAQRGFRPVPLYNAVPMPTIFPFEEPITVIPMAAVDVRPILNALKTEAERLGQQHLPFNAPPVFLLDVNRRSACRSMTPGHFDNRSVCFTTDFPSANFLHAQGIERVVLVQRDRIEPMSDLAHALRRWQDGGLVMERMRIDAAATPERFEVRKPWWFGMMFQRALMAFGLRRASGGGFGAWVPTPSSG
jgi:hypothetical protein